MSTARYWSDADTRLPIELWAGRVAEHLAAWLRAHPGVEVVCRGGSLVHRQGIAAGAPDAVQVSEAWIDLSSSTLRFLSHLLAARRLERGTRWRRLSADRQALLVLAHVRCGHTCAQLAAGSGVGIATVHQYVTEAVEVLVVLAPDLTAAARTASRKAFVILTAPCCPSTGSPPTDRTTPGNTGSTG